MSERILTERLLTLELTLADLMSAIERVGDWPEESRVGRSLERAEKVLQTESVLEPSTANVPTINKGE